MLVLYCFVILLGWTAGQRGSSQAVRETCSTSDLFYQCKNEAVCGRYIDDLQSVCKLVRSLQVPTPSHIATFEPTTFYSTQSLPRHTSSDALVQETSDSGLTASRPGLTTSHPGLTASQPGLTTSHPGLTTSPGKQYNYDITTKILRLTTAPPDNSIEDQFNRDDGRSGRSGNTRIPATILEPPLNITVPPGATARFSCKSQGAPAPLTTITQRNDDVEAPNHEKVGSERITVVSVIQEIENVNEQNEGWYRCIASNAWGITQHDAYLRVRDLCADLDCGDRKTCKADYIRATAECVCQDCTGTQYNITCATNCQNYFNPCALERDNCRDDTDFGVLFNGYCPRIVVPSPRVSAGDELYFSQGENLRLSCTVSASANPAPLVYWTKTDDEGRVSEVSYSAVLRIRSLEEDDTGTYRCVATQCENVYTSEEVYVLVESEITEGIDNLEVQKSVCTVFGDPHFMTFDGVAYDYMGECDYVLAMDCLYANWLVYGRIEKCSKRENSGSCLSSVTVFSGAAAVELQRGWIINHQGNKMNITDGDTLRNGPMLVSFDGRNLRVNLDTSGVEVIWDGLVSVHITVPMGSNTCGLCGNNDFNPTNDLITRGGTAGDAIAIGDSWAVDRMDICKKNIPNTNQGCSLTTTGLATQRCEAAFRASGLDRCTIDTGPYIAGCIVDVCSQNWISEKLPPECIAVSTYVERCSIDGTSIYGWQESIDCPALYQTQDIIVSEGCPQDIDRLLRRRKTT